MDNLTKKHEKLVEAFVYNNKKYMEGTITVMIKRKFKHPIYGKIINAEKKQIVDYPKKELIPIGTKVYIKTCAPISKRKHFRIVEVENVN